MKTAVIGLGYWGPNIVRNLLGLHHSVSVYDTDERRIRMSVERFPACQPASSLDSIMDDPSIEAVFLAVPLPSHYELVLRALKSHKHVFVEKPLCYSTAEADSIALHLNHTVFMVGHITEFSDGIRALASHVRDHSVGNVRRLRLLRTHMGPVYRGTDVLTEVAAHDIAIVTSLVPELPATIHAWGTPFLANDSKDAAHIVLQWANGCLAQVDVGWTSAIRRREIEVEGTEGTIVFRGYPPPEEITVFHQKKAFEALRSGTDQGTATLLVDTSRRVFPAHESLRAELSHFLSCVERSSAPTPDIHFARKVVRILEAARTSMNNGGKEIRLA